MSGWAFLVPRADWSFTRYPRDPISHLIFRCPDCKKDLRISIAHVVDDKGNVYPRAKCPFPGCSFVGTIEFEAWDPDLTPLDRDRGEEVLPPDALVPDPGDVMWELS